MARKINFKISARTARLIGRQNFPNSEGAIIELVKNSYDADADTCLLIFDDRFLKIPNTLSVSYFQKFSEEEELINVVYKPEDGDYCLIAEEDFPKIENVVQKLQSFFQSKCKIFIIDNGEGMTDQIIEDCWMIIGTSNKESEIYTSTGRIKTGAKGIGRFALDKLGDKAILRTKPDPAVHKGVKKNQGYQWEIDWRDFEGDARILNQINAELSEIAPYDYNEEIRELIKAVNLINVDDNIEFNFGTIIEIGFLRNSWDQPSLERLYKNLEILIPPKEDSEFKIYMYSLSNKGIMGEVSPEICDDFDYKLHANINNAGVAEIEIYRNEFKLSELSDDFFKRPIIKELNIVPKKNNRYYLKIQRVLKDLVPGLSKIDKDNILDKIGSFDFSFYFMKNTASSEEQKKFVYKEFTPTLRNKWLKQFCGIKIFRDNFRVRPYGEAESRSFDWLNLGARANKSPQSIGQQRPGTWLVRPNQISGIVNISRITNLDFVDTSSRAGLQENEVFNYFAEILLGIINEFEKDRTLLGRELAAFYKEKYDTVSEEDAENASNEIKIKLQRNRTETYNDHEKLKEYTESLELESETVAKYSEQLKEQIEEMKNETNLLRVLASNALIIASFSHELNNIKDNLVSRFDQISEELRELIQPSILDALPDYKNPIISISDAKEDDVKLKQWLQYSIESLRKDKRRKKQKDLKQYFIDFKEFWQFACESKGVVFEIKVRQDDEIKFRVFEADLDSIFNNLMVNSFEAFLQPHAPAIRNITISIFTEEMNVIIQYRDSGPGLSSDIHDKNSIFLPHFTTKRDLFTGAENGTGLGMWLVKTIIEENNGEVIIVEDKNFGFGLDIILKNKIGA